MESYTKYPSRIIPFCSVNPNWGDYAIDQISEYLQDGMAGVGELHPSLQQFRLEDTQITSFWNKLIEIYPTFQIYRDRTDRKIPLIKLIKV